VPAPSAEFVWFTRLRRSTLPVAEPERVRIAHKLLVVCASEEGGSRSPAARALVDELGAYASVGSCPWSPRCRHSRSELVAMGYPKAHIARMLDVHDLVVPLQRLKRVAPSLDRDSDPSPFLKRAPPVSEAGGRQPTRPAVRRPRRLVARPALASARCGARMLPGTRGALLLLPRCDSEAPQARRLCALPLIAQSDSGGWTAASHETQP
jgi:hypothetical protein